MSFSAYPAYKSSGCDRLGPVPDHWQVLPCRALVDECVEKNSFGRITEYLSLMANVGIIRYEDKGDVGNKKPDDLSKCKIVKRGDLVINSMNYGIGSYGLSPLDGICSPVYIVLDPKDDVIVERFVLRIFEEKEFQAFAQSFGNGILAHRSAIGWDDLKNVLVALPPIPEQILLASFLDHETARIDALIEEQQRLIELLKEKRQAVISHAVTKGLDPTVPMKDSGVEWLGEVPAHWVVSRAKLVSDIFVPQRNKPELNDSEGVAWVTMEDMNGGYISATSLKVTELAADEAGSKVLKKGAVIASCVGRFGIVAINAVDVVINQQLQAFEPIKIKAEYLKNIVSLSKEYFELVGTAATLVYVNQLGFENLPVLIPSGSEQESICLYVDEANARFDALLSQSFESIQLLQERRSALISAAVTGKIDVRGWQPPASVPSPELVEEAV